MEPKKKYGSFQDLDVYKAAREFRRMVYKLAKQLPESEKYNLNIQMRRAALSLTNNIPEGHGRFHYLDNIRFMLISRGSLVELVDDLRGRRLSTFRADRDLACRRDELVAAN